MVGTPAFWMETQSFSVKKTMDKYKKIILMNGEYSYRNYSYSLRTFESLPNNINIKFFR